MDRPVWNTLGEAVLRYPSNTPLKTILKREGYGKDVLWEAMVRRWARYAMAVEPTNPLLILYWQMFFALYFYRLPAVGGQQRGSGNVISF